MKTRETLSFDRLQLELVETEGELRVAWRGRSDDRQPERFLAPVMREALERACRLGGTLVLDFGTVDYLNSSTFTPVVRLLDQVARGAGKVRIEYDRARKWQVMSFSALKAFETGDGRVAIHAR